MVLSAACLVQKQKFERVSQLELLKLVYELVLSKAEPQLWKKQYSAEALAIFKKQQERSLNYEYRVQPGKHNLREESMHATQTTIF